MVNKSFVGLDVGEKRIGVAVADSSVLIAMPLDTVEVDGSEVDTLNKLLAEQTPDVVVVGYPRNQSGEPTKQSTFVEQFIEKLDTSNTEVVYQDESLTSVMAEDRLKVHNRPYTKGDIDAQAATIILQDYLETKYAEQ